MSQNSLQNDLIVLYEKTREKVRGFQKKTYQSDMGILKEENQTLLECVKETIEKSEKCMQEVAGYVPEYASEMLSQIDSKRKREAAVIDHNMAMVAFFVPLMGEIQSTQTKIFTEKIVEIWNQKVPGSKIGHSDAASIENGFKKGVFCYITTAVCKSLNKPDDCYELNLLREYRDQYLMGTKDGEILVKEYYNIAPTIVKRIDRSPDASEIYADIWEKYLKPCVSQSKFPLSTIAPPTQAACPSIYFVVECVTISAPHSNGRQLIGVANVLSTINGTPCACAAFANFSRSRTTRAGLAIVSPNTAFVFS